MTAWAVPALALVMLGLTLTPAEVWTAPAVDAVYRNFDLKLVYVKEAGGAVKMNTQAIEITAAPTTQPTVNLATALLQRFSASVDVVVLENRGASEPLRIGVWSPWTTTGYFVVFAAAPQNLITVESVVNGQPSSTLLGGDVTSTIVGQYQPGNTYRVAFGIDKSTETITADISGDGNDIASTAVNSRELPALFNNSQLALTASSAPGSGSSHVILRNYSLTIPHQRAWASKVADPKASALLASLALLGLVVAGIAIATHAWSALAGFRSTIVSRRAATLGRHNASLVAGAIGLYLVGNALLFQVGSHPFDSGVEKLHAYVARIDGPAALYFLPNVVSLPGIWGGVPLVESAFPYEAVFAYLAAGIGWLSSLVTGDTSFSPHSVAIDYVIKAVNVLFGLGDAILIYSILRQTRVSAKWSLIGGALFLFNPAVWFSMSIWGQTHVTSLFFVLLAILMAERNVPLLAWMALVAACLTRPQMMVFALLLGIVFLRKFHWNENLQALSWTVIVTFLFLLPLTLATSPSLPVDVLLHNLRIQEAGGNVATLTTVSQDAYSIWPLITYLAHGAHGLERAFTPASGELIGSLTYQRFSQILTLVALLTLSAVLALKKRAAHDASIYVPLVGLGMVCFLMLMTGVVATHFLLALPFLLLSRRSMGTVEYLLVAATWTLTTLIPMYGDMGVALFAQSGQLLAPAHNALTRFVIYLYAWDRTITVAVVANICVLIWLGASTLRPIPPLQKAH